MEKLIKAYLKHTGHYLADSEMFSVRSVFAGNECIYDVELSNDCLASGREVIMVTVSELLLFLFERQL